MLSYQEARELQALRREVDELRERVAKLEKPKRQPKPRKAPRQSFPHGRAALTSEGQIMGQALGRTDDG